ncbi:MAG TPA: DUF5684 domain-containing protein [Planctomycetaceae bacterium]|nr:DUF5684 domain-containing protein [Planctomycetaceae bacterium]
MSIEVTCPGCGAKFKLAEKYAERRLVCAKCQHEFGLSPLSDGSTGAQLNVEAPPAAAPKPERTEPPRRPAAPRQPQFSGATTPARGSRVEQSPLSGSPESWEEPDEVDLEPGALPPRQEAGMPVKGRKRRIPKREGKSDWPVYALGIVGACLLGLLQGLLIWNNLAKLSAAPTGQQAASDWESTNANLSTAGTGDARALPLDRYLSRKSQADLGLVVTVTYVVMTVFFFVGVGATFAKAGKPSWAAIVPVYNVILWLRIGGRPWWWLLLLLVPFVNLFVFLMVSIDIAHNFGKRATFGLGLTFLGFVFYPALGFGNARYRPYW